MLFVLCVSCFPACDPCGPSHFGGCCVPDAAIHLLPVKSWDLTGWPWKVFCESSLKGIIPLIWGFPSCSPSCHHPSHPLSWPITPTSCSWCLLPSPKPLYPLHLFSSCLKAAGKQGTLSGLSLSPFFHPVGYNMYLVTSGREGPQRC